jgi:Protein of unknown function (DUF795).
MPVLGIVAEYNPLHSGHEWHIKKSRELTGADHAVCVLSSQFVQRGEPAIVSKWARTRMALECGIDLVIELPCPFSCASAEYFASAAVRLLDSLGVVDYISFGSESGTLESLSRAADFLAEETPEFREALRKRLDSGMSFPAARQAALRDFLDDRTCEAVSSPNNILGIEYLKALRKTGSGLKPVTIPRIGQGYSEKSLGYRYSSATAIRNHIMSRFKADEIYAGDTGNSVNKPTAGSLLEGLEENMPESSLKILDEEFRQGRGPVFFRDFEDVLLYRLRTASDEELSALPYMEEGLANRLRQASTDCKSLEEVLNYCTTNRYPTSRISRILCSLLLGTTGSFLEELKNAGYVRYIRVLGFNEKGRKLLSAARKKASLPIITRPAGYRRIRDSLAKRLFEFDARATDVYVLGYKRPELKKGHSEFRTMPVILN